MEEIQKRSRLPHWLWPTSGWARAGAVLGFLVFVLAASAAFLRHLATTEFGRGVIVSMIDGRRAGPLGTIRLSGLEGDPLSSATAEDLAFIDENGAWMRADGIELSWSPFDLLFRRLEIERLHVDTVHVFRRPVVAPREPSGGGLPDFSIRLGEASADRILIDDGVYGAQASYAFNLTTEVARDRAGAFDLAITPLNGMGDEITASAAWTRDRLTLANLSATGLAGGTLTSLIQSPAGQPVSLTLEASGGLSDLGATGALRFGEHVAARLDVTQQGPTSRAVANLDLASWPLLEDLSARLGQTLDLSATLDLDDIARAPVQFNLTAEAGRVAGAGLIDLNRRELLGPLTLSLQEIDLARQSSVLTSGTLSGEGDVQVDGLTQWTWTGQLSVTAFATEAIAAETIETSGTISMSQGAIAWRADPGEARRVRLPSLSSAPDMALTFSSSGAYRLAERIVEIDQTSINSALGASTVAGSYDLNTGALELSGTARGAELSAISNWDGLVSGQWSVERRNTNTPYVISVDGGGENLAPPNAALASLLGAAPTLGGTATWQGGRLLIQSANLRSETVALNIAGQSAPSGALSGSLAGSVLAPLDLPGALVEQLEISGTLGGTLSQPTAQLLVENGAIRTSGVYLTEMSGRSFLQNNERLSARSTFQGEIDGRPLEASFELSPVAGGVGLTDLQVAAGGLNLTAPSLAIVDGNPAGSFALDGSLTGLAGFSGGEVAATGRFDTEGGAPRISVSGEATGIQRPGVDLHRATFDAAIRADTLQLDTVLEGRGDAGPRLSVGVTGARDGATWSGDARMQGVAGAQPIAMTQPAGWSFGPDGYSFSGAASLLAGDVSAEVSSLAGTQALDLQVSTIDLRALSRLVQLSPVVGGLSGHIRIDAPGDGPRTGQFNLDFSGLNPLGAEIEPLDIDLRGQLQDQSLVVTATGAGGAFSIDGGAQLVLLGEGLALIPDRDAPFEGRLDLEGRAEQFWTLTRQQDQALSGALAANLTARGNLGSPILDGGFSLNDAVYDHGESGFRLQDIALVGRFDQRSVELTSLTGADGQGGTLSGEGRLDWAGELDGGVDFVANGLRALNRDDRSAVVTGSGSISVEPAAMLISGEMEIVNARFSVEQPASARIPTLTSVRRVNFPGREDVTRVEPPRRPIRLDLKVEAPRRVFVYGRGLDMEWSTDLDVTGSITNPIVDGRATLIRGDLNLAGRRFPFDDGTISLDGPIRSARIDITATGNAASTEARVRLVGTPVDPEFRLESSPALPQDEILSRLIFGRSAAELSALETAQLAAALAQLAGGQAAFDPASVLREATGLDRVTIGAEGDTASIAAGKYIAEDVFLQIGAGGEGGAAAEVEWEPVDSLSVTSSARGNGDTRMTVRWKKDY